MIFFGREELLEICIQFSCSSFAVHFWIVLLVLAVNLVSNFLQPFDVALTVAHVPLNDRLEGYPRRKLPEALHATIRPLALQKLAELRALGFEDPVDALLAVAYETDEEGEFVQPVEIRIECLKAAAPFCRPKLQAVVQRNVGEGMGHAEWLKELKGYVEQEENADDDYQGGGNGRARTDLIRVSFW